MILDLAILAKHIQTLIRQGETIQFVENGIVKLTPPF